MPLPLLLVIVKLPFTRPPAAVLPVGWGTATEYVGPARVTALSWPVPIVASSAACIVTMI